MSELQSKLMRLAGYHGMDSKIYGNGVAINIPFLKNGSLIDDWHYSSKVSSTLYILGY